MVVGNLEKFLIIKFEYMETEQLLTTVDNTLYGDKEYLHVVTVLVTCPNY
jgi:hypothetical protein